MQKKSGNKIAVGGSALSHIGLVGRLRLVCAFPVRQICIAKLTIIFKTTNYFTLYFKNNSLVFFMVANVVLFCLFLNSAYVKQIYYYRA